MLVTILIATVIAVLVLYANARLNPDATIKNIVHVGVVILYVLYVLDLLTGRHLLGRLG